MKLHLMNNITVDHLPDDFTLVPTLEEAEIVLVRSASLHNVPIPPKLRMVVRVGTGTDNIPIDTMTSQGVIVCNTPGTNSNSVKELVLAMLIVASRNAFKGTQWVTTNAKDPELAKNVEKHKKQFVGHEIAGHTLGVIGLGNVGRKVAEAARDLGMHVIVYDPFITLSHELESSGLHPTHNLEEIYTNCDYITLHVPLMSSTQQLINQQALSMMKKGVVILNFSRDSIVDEATLLTFLDEGHGHTYVTDFPHPLVASHPSVIALPHIGASTIESEERSLQLAVDEVIAFMGHGILNNSLNFPHLEVAQGLSKHHRLICLYRHTPLTKESIVDFFAQHDYQIKNVHTGIKNDAIMTMVDGEKPIDESILESFKLHFSALKSYVI